MMKEIIGNKYFLLFSRIVLGFIFIYSGMEKISEPSLFADSIQNYRIFPLVSINILAVIIPWIELTAGLLLLLGVAVKENAAIIISFLGMFILLIIISLLRGLDIDCGCFGSNQGQSIGLIKILENILLSFLGVQLFYFDSGLFSIKNVS